MEAINIYINKNEFMQKLIDEIGSDNFQTAIKAHNSQDFISGAMFGMSWAGVLTASCQEYIAPQQKGIDL